MVDISTYTLAYQRNWMWVSSDGFEEHIISGTWNDLWWISARIPWLINETGCGYNEKMKTTINEIENLLSSSEIDHISMEQARARMEENYSWREAMDVFAKQGVEDVILRAGLLISCVFDTYGPAVKNIVIKAEMDQDGQDSFLIFNAAINGHWLYTGGLENTPGMEPFHQVDQCRALEAMIEHLEDLGDEILLPKLDEIQAHLNDTFESAQQVREMMEQGSERLYSWSKSKLLANRAEELREEQKSIPGAGRSPKM